jgi:hypothetical protein
MVIITEDINAQDTVLANNGLQVLLESWGDWQGFSH